MPKFQAREIRRPGFNCRLKACYFVYKVLLYTFALLTLPNPNPNPKAPLTPSADVRLRPSTQRASAATPINMEMQGASYVMGDVSTWIPPITMKLLVILYCVH